MEKRYANLWAKTNGSGWHPLVLHMLDVAACVDAVLEREPHGTRVRMGDVLGLPWEQARPWILLLSANHDIGKASPAFQYKWDGAQALLAKAGFRKPPGLDTTANHAFISQFVLDIFLTGLDWPAELASLASDAVGCHHGVRGTPRTLSLLGGNRKALGGQAWEDSRRAMFVLLRDVLRMGDPPTKPSMSGTDFMLLSGLVSFSDWIGSNEEWFSFGRPEDCDDLPGWFCKRRETAREALNAIGWNARKPLAPDPLSFKSVFGFQPRPLQVALTDAVQTASEPAVFLVEAPMGEGKTEAAFHAHLELQRRFSHRGLYVALPTKATGNAMFRRTLQFLNAFDKQRILDLQLLHGNTLLNDDFQGLRKVSIDDPDGNGGIRAGEWFTRKKRALLSEYGVGTVDQALLTILPVRHHFVRLWGLANRVVVFDEIHAYDAYTGTLLIHLVRWLLSLGSSIILLSATLPPSVRRRLAAVVRSPFPEEEVAYPRVTCYRNGSIAQLPFSPDPARRRLIRIEGVEAGLPAIRSMLEERLALGGYGLALMNTVPRAQDLYSAFPEGEPIRQNGFTVGKRLPDGTEIILFHARFPADLRQKREESVLAIFGVSGVREGRRILVATQVAEQSLDLDFDLIVTDLAPIDLVLQRAGRLWRHERGCRPLEQPSLLIAGLSSEEPPSFGKPLWWGEVYREDILLKTWALLCAKPEITLPDEIDGLVQAVYEDRVTIPEVITERMEKALVLEGKPLADRQQANQAIIGLPDDCSWNDPAMWIKADDDEAGIHPTLIAQTRLGKPSVVVIPIFPSDGFQPEAVPPPDDARKWFVRALSLSRLGVVSRLRKVGVPKGWQASSLLRNCHPLVLDEGKRWVLDQSVRLDEELGLVYGKKEVS